LSKGACAERIGEKYNKPGSFFGYSFQIQGFEKIKMIISGKKSVLTRKAYAIDF
jgi:hypothetical protein